MRDAQLVSNSDKKAKKMGLLTNDEVFAHALNAVHPTSKDPRTQEQVDAKDISESEQPVWESDGLVTGRRHSEIGFITTPETMKHQAKGSDLLPDHASREGYNLNKKPIHEWQDMEIVIALGHKRLTIDADGGVFMSFKDMAETPAEARWKFVKVKAEETNDPAAAGEEDDPLESMKQGQPSIYKTSEEEEIMAHHACHKARLGSHMCTRSEGGCKSSPTADGI